MLRNKVNTPALARQTCKSIIFCKTLITWLVLCLCSGFYSPILLAQYEPDPRGLVIVMNINTDIQSMNHEQIRDLFTGKSRRMPNGKRAALASFGPEASFFNQNLLLMSNADVAAVWSRLRFSGRTPPPREFSTPQQVVDYVVRTPNALAYLPASVARKDVRVISNLPR